MHRLSTLLATTRRQPPADASATHDALLVRAGMLHRTSAGTALLGPLLVRTFRRVEAIVRAELDDLGSQEVRLPAAGPFDELREQFVIDQLSSHRQLPVLLYELAARPRHEPDPRLGLLRTTAATVAAVWSYDLDVAAARTTAEHVAAAYGRALSRCGLEPAAADAGLRDGEPVTAVVTPSGAGDVVLARSDAGPYRALAGAARAALATPPPGDPRPATRVETPGATTMAALRTFVSDVPPDRTVKTLLYGVLTAEGAEVVAVLCRGDRSVDEGKLAQALGAREVALADADTVRSVTGAAPGYAGPIGLDAGIRVVGDRALDGVQGFVCGANEDGAHLRDVWWGRDVGLPPLLDLDRVQAGDPAEGGGVLDLLPAIEVARVAAGAPAPGITVTGPDGARQPVRAGSAALVVERVVGAVVERHHDDAGLVWPAAVAPHTVSVVTVRADDETQARVAGQVLGALGAAGVDALWDDRDLGAGAKFTDAELLGFPWRVTVGRHAADGRVEVTDRRDGATHVCTVADAVERLADATAPHAVPPLA